jgi:PKD repeat protein
VRIYRDNPAGTGGVLVGTVTANGTHAAPYNGYGYTWTPPTDGIAHPYYVYAQDAQNGQWNQLAGTPTAALTCWPPPMATLVSVTQGNYCTGGPQATANWQYTSAGSLPQTQYQLQFATDPGFAAITYDSGVKPTAPTTPPPSLHSGGTGTGVLQFATTYWVRVRAWDSLGQASAWSAALTATTAAAAYPTANFTYTPAQVFAGIPVQFSDSSSNTPIAWAWDFGDGQSGFGTGPSNTYAAAGSYNVRLDATNAAGTCSVTKTIDANKPLPQYQEVRPGVIRQ